MRASVLKGLRYLHEEDEASSPKQVEGVSFRRFVRHRLLECRQARFDAGEGRHDFLAVIFLERRLKIFFSFWSRRNAKRKVVDVSMRDASCVTVFIHRAREETIFFF